MKSLIAVFALLLSVNAFAAQERNVLKGICDGKAFDVYFTPADHIVGEAAYYATLTDEDTKVTQRVVGLSLAPMGEVRIVIHGDKDSETVGSLLGAVYSQNGGIVQLDPADAQGAPELRAEALKGDIAVAVESQHWFTAAGLINITGGYIPQIGQLIALPQAGQYEAIAFDWNKVEFASFCARGK